MRARAVIGASFGDEGKGLVTDWLCSQGADVVVRFNGGAQAGHTVQLKNGKRHVFHHYGAGTLRGVPTFLSQFFICNPILFLKERDELRALKAPVDSIKAHPDCLVTTFADMMINQRLETMRGKDRHGSVGVGINETIERSTVDDLKITMRDVWDNRARIKDVLKEICTKYAMYRMAEEIPNPDHMIEAFIKGCEVMAAHVSPGDICDFEDPVFEGAQGLLLDQNNKEFFPHLTRSNTGLQNVRVLCAQGLIDHIEPYYVSRTYLTRHGAGPLPGEDINIRYEDLTNEPHAYQGVLRFAPLDPAALIARCKKDAAGLPYKLVMTHTDQRPTPMTADYFSNGPTAEDIT